MASVSWIRVGRVVAAVGAVAWACVVLAPLYYLVLNSLRPLSEYLKVNPWVPGGALGLGNYRAALSGGIAIGLRNSILVSAGCCILVVLTTLPAAYAVARSGLPVVRGFYLLCLLGLAVPLEGIVVPLFVEVTFVHLYNSLLAVVIPVAAFNVPIAIIILSSFIRDIPDELIDAMRLDGGRDLQILRRLVGPMTVPALISVVIYVGVGSWNSFLLPLVVTQTRGAEVVPLEIFRFEGTNGSDVPAILASVVLSALPLFMLYAVGRRRLIEGMSVGLR